MRAATASPERSERPRLVCRMTPVALMTGRSVRAVRLSRSARAAARSWDESGVGAPSRIAARAESSAARTASSVSGRPYSPIKSIADASNTSTLGSCRRVIERSLAAVAQDEEALDGGERGGGPGGAGPVEGAAQQQPGARRGEDAHPERLAKEHAGGRR